MKEVFTKSFWEGVKKTFHEALEDQPPSDAALQTAIEKEQSASSTSEKPSSSSASTERN